MHKRPPNRCRTLLKSRKTISNELPQITYRELSSSLRGFAPLMRCKNNVASSTDSRKERMSALTGFTLIELLVVIAIIGILASVVLTNVNSARSKGSDAGIIQTIGNMRAQAEIFYDEALTYSGMCDDASIQAALSKAAEFNGGVAAICVDGDDVAGAWAIESPLAASTTQYYCVDYTGDSNRYGLSTISATSSDANCG